MKFFMSAAILAGLMVAPNSFACSLLQDCGNYRPHWRICWATDSLGQRFKYSMQTQFPQKYNIQKALEKCGTQSKQPKSCKFVECYVR